MVSADGTDPDGPDPDGTTPGGAGQAAGSPAPRGTPSERPRVSTETDMWLTRVVTLSWYLVTVLYAERRRLALYWLLSLVAALVACFTPRPRLAIIALAGGIALFQGVGLTLRHTRAQLATPRGTSVRTGSLGPTGAALTTGICLEVAQALLMLSVLLGVVVGSWLADRYGLTAVHDVRVPRWFHHHVAVRFYAVYGWSGGLWVSSATSEIGTFSGYLAFAVGAVLRSVRAARLASATAAFLMFSPLAFGVTPLQVESPWPTVVMEVLSACVGVVAIWLWRHVARDLLTPQAEVLGLGRDLSLAERRVVWASVRRAVRRDGALIRRGWRCLRSEGLRHVLSSTFTVSVCLEAMDEARGLAPSPRARAKVLEVFAHSGVSLDQPVRTLGLKEVILVGFTWALSHEVAVYLLPDIRGLVSPEALRVLDSLLLERVEKGADIIIL